MLKSGVLVLILIQLLFGLGRPAEEREKFMNLIDAFLFVSETHQLLHIMMGEEEGDQAVAYAQFSEMLEGHKLNPELNSVVLAFERISDKMHPEKTGAVELDALVDYQQLVFQFGYQAIFKAYGYFGEVPTAAKELEKLSRQIEELEDLRQLTTLFAEN